MYFLHTWSLRWLKEYGDAFVTMDDESAEFDVYVLPESSDDSRLYTGMTEWGTEIDAYAIYTDVSDYELRDYLTLQS